LKEERNELPRRKQRGILEKYLVILDSAKNLFVDSSSADGGFRMTKIAASGREFNPK